MNIIMYEFFQQKQDHTDSLCLIMQLAFIRYRYLFVRQIFIDHVPYARHSVRLRDEKAKSRSARVIAA